MASHDPEINRLSAQIGGLGKNQPDADTTDLKRDLKAAKARAYIERLVESAPPLSASQLDSLAALLRPSRAEARAA